MPTSSMISIQAAEAPTQLCPLGGSMQHKTARTLATSSGDQRTFAQAPRADDLEVELQSKLHEPGTACRGDLPEG